MVVEVMGRHAGWIALHSGLAGSADAILIPEIPFDIEQVCEKIRERESRGIHFSIVVAAEGAHAKDGAPIYQDNDSAQRLGGIGLAVAAAIAERTGKETRELTLGHLQRGGTPTTFDRLLGLRFGAAAVRAVADGHFGCMVALDPPDVRLADLSVATKGARLVDRDSDILRTARELGVALGD